MVFARARDTATMQIKNCDHALRWRYGRGFDLGTWRCSTVTEFTRGAA